MKDSVDSYFNKYTSGPVSFNTINKEGKLTKLILNKLNINEEEILKVRMKILLNFKKSSEFMQRRNSETMFHVGSVFYELLEYTKAIKNKFQEIKDGSSKMRKKILQKFQSYVYFWCFS